MDDVGVVWTAEDERSHPKSMQEWWSTEAFLSSGKNGRRWSLRAYLWDFLETSKRPGSYLIITLLDEATGKQSTYVAQTENRLRSATDRFQIQYEDSCIKGAYPVYDLCFHDKDHGISLELRYTATSFPYWVGKDVTDGWLPMGLGVFRYGFIPKFDVAGSVRIRDESFQVIGAGYLEHIWGDFSFYNAASRHFNLLKSASIYFRLIVWWLKNNKIHLPKSLLLCSENNPMGNDWAWGLLDNGWTVFYGNIMFWLMSGPAMGTLIVSKDGKSFTEYGTLSFRYKKIKYDATYDFVYPTELEVTARKGEETLHLFFDMNPARDEVLDVFSKDNQQVGLVVCENPGHVRGEYESKTERVPLSGVCKLEFQRQLSLRGRSQLSVSLCVPPDGFGLMYEYESHFLGKKIKGRLGFFPWLRCSWSMERIPKKTQKEQLV